MRRGSQQKRPKIASAAAAAKKAQGPPGIREYTPDPSYMSSAMPSYLQAAVSIHEHSRQITDEENKALAALLPNEKQIILQFTIPAADLNYGTGLVNCTSLKDGTVILPQLRSNAKPSRQHIRTTSLRYLEIMLLLNAISAGTVQFKEADRPKYQAATDRLRKTEKGFQEGLLWTQFSRTKPKGSAARSGGGGGGGGVVASAAAAAAIAERAAEIGNDGVPAAASSAAANAHEVNDPEEPSPYSYWPLLFENVLDKQQSSVVSIRFWLFVRGKNPDADLKRAWGELQKYGAIRYEEEFSHIKNLGYTASDVSRKDAEAQRLFLNGGQQGQAQQQQQDPNAISILAPSARPVAQPFDDLLNGVDFGDMGDEEAPPSIAPEELTRGGAGGGGNANVWQNANNGNGGGNDDNNNFLINAAAGLARGGGAGNDDDDGNEKAVSGVAFARKYGLCWDDVPKSRRRCDEGSIMPWWLNNIMQVVSERWHKNGIPASGVQSMFESVTSGRCLEYAVPFETFKRVCPVEAGDVESSNRMPDFVRLNSAGEANERRRYRKPVEKLEATGIVCTDRLNREWAHLGDYNAQECCLTSFQPAYLYPAHALSTWNSDASSTKQMFIGNYFRIEGIDRRTDAIDGYSQRYAEIKILAETPSASLHTVLDNYIETSDSIVRSLGVGLNDLDSVQAMLINHGGQDPKFGYEPSQVGELFTGFPVPEQVHIVSPLLAVDPAAIVMMYFPPPPSKYTQVENLMQWETSTYTSDEAIKKAFGENSYRGFTYLYDFLKWVTKPLMRLPFANATPADKELAKSDITSTILFGSAQQVQSLMRYPESVWLNARADSLFTASTIAQLLAARMAARLLATMATPMYSFWQSCSNAESLALDYGSGILECNPVGCGSAGASLFSAPSINSLNPDPTAVIDQIKWPGWFDSQDPSVVKDDLNYTDWKKLINYTRETIAKQHEHLRRSFDSSLAILEPTAFLRQLKTKSAVLPYRAHATSQKMAVRLVKWHQARLYDRLWKDADMLRSKSVTVSKVIDAARNGTLTRDPVTGEVAVLSGESAVEDRHQLLEDEIQSAFSAKSFSTSRDLDSERFNHRSMSPGQNTEPGVYGYGRVSSAAFGTGPEYDPPTMGAYGTSFTNNRWFQAGALRARCSGDIDAFRSETHFPEFLCRFHSNFKRFIRNLVYPVEEYAISMRLSREQLDHPAMSKARILFDRFRTAAITAVGTIQQLGNLIMECNSRPAFCWPVSYESRPALARVFETIYSAWRTVYGKSSAATKFPYRECYTRWKTYGDSYSCYDRAVSEGLAEQGIGEGNTAPMVAYAKILLASVETALVLEPRKDNVVALSVLCSGGTGEGKSYVAKAGLQLVTPGTWEAVSSNSAMARNTVDNADGCIEYMDEGAAPVTGSNAKQLDEKQISDWKSEQSEGFLTRLRSYQDEETGKWYYDKTVSSRRVCKILCQNQTKPSDDGLAARFLHLYARQLFTAKNQPIWDSIIAHVSQSSALDPDARAEAENRVLGPLRMVHALKGILEMGIYAGLLKVEFESIVNYANNLMEVVKSKIDYSKSKTRLHTNMSRLIRSQVTTLAAFNIILFWITHNEVNGFSATTSEIPMDFIFKVAPRFLMADTNIATKCVSMLFYAHVESQEQFNVMQGFLALANYGLKLSQLRFAEFEIRRPGELISRKPRMKSTFVKKAKPVVNSADDVGQNDEDEVDDYLESYAPNVKWSDEASVWAEKDAAVQASRGAIAGAPSPDSLRVLDMNYVVLEIPEATTEKQFCIKLASVLPSDGKYDHSHIPPILKDMSNIEVEMKPEEDRNRKFVQEYAAFLRRKQGDTTLPPVYMDMFGVPENNNDHRKRLDRLVSPAYSPAHPSTLEQDDALSSSSFADEFFDIDMDQVVTGSAAEEARKAMPPPPAPAKGEKSAGKKSKGGALVSASFGSGKQQALSSFMEPLPKTADIFSRIENDTAPTALERIEAETKQLEEENQMRTMMNSYFHQAEFRDSLTLDQAASAQLPLLHYSADRVNRLPLIRIYGGEYKKKTHRIAVLYSALEQVHSIISGKTMGTGESAGYNQRQRPYKGTMLTLLEHRSRDIQMHTPFPSFVPSDIYHKDSSNEVTQYIPTAVMAMANTKYVARFAEAVVERAIALHSVMNAPPLDPNVKTYLSGVPQRILSADVTMTVCDMMKVHYGNRDEFRPIVNKTTMAKWAPALSKHRSMLTHPDTPCIENVESMVHDPLDRIVASYVEYEKRLGKIDQGLRMFPFGADFESYLVYCSQSHPPRDPCDPTNFMALSLCFKHGLDMFLADKKVAANWDILSVDNIHAELAKSNDPFDRKLATYPDARASTEYPQADLDFQLKNRFFIYMHQRFHVLGPKLKQLDPSNFPSLSPAGWLLKAVIQLTRWFGPEDPKLAKGAAGALHVSPQ